MKSKKHKRLTEYDFQPEKQEALLERIDLVETLQDPLFTEKEVREIKNRYMEKTGCSERTLRNYLRRYKEEGALGLVLYDHKKIKEPSYSLKLEDKIISLIEENPRRSIPKIRELLLKITEFNEEASFVSERQFYRIAKNHGFDRKGRALLIENVKRNYRSFEAPHSMALVQGDARDGIWIDCTDGKKRKTYLFVWLDDYSRKILYAQYYWDEKLPRMEDSFRKMALRYGLPEKVYLDNGNVYISTHFRIVLSDLKIKKIHHPPYQSYCKGKIEAANKKIKYDFQDEAQYAGFRTLEELNSALHAWIEVKYDKRALSTTGEAPGERFVKGLTKEIRRIDNLDRFMQYFLYRDTRTVNKYGRIKLKGNNYPVKNGITGKVVNVRYDPFDLTKIFIYDNDGVLIETVEPATLKNIQDPHIPEESKKPLNEVRESAKNYFASLRKLHIEARKKAMPNPAFEKLSNKENANE
ncbi:MAG: DDE-type integrase/transposase/recombinase [Proteobacteria bacterium]|nr:DDE-type integrase/transposase/recombinase [Pseudomonadota bacterium]